MPCVVNENSETNTLISIIVPCRNERDQVEDSIGSLLNQEVGDDRIELWVADGSSDDGTREFLDALSQEDPRLRVLDNPDRRTPSALKLLLTAAAGEFIVRADAHSVYPSDYVATLVSVLKETGADNVGGVWDTQPWDDSVQARAVAAALTSRFGVGVSYRTQRGAEPIEAETVPFGAWRASHFEAFGPFDETFVRAQDLEHNVRVRRMGGRILCLPWLRIRYFARPTLGRLARMAYQYGYWKIPVRAKHPVRFSLRQYIPPTMVGGTTACLVASIWFPWALVPVIIYFLAVLLAAIHVSVSARAYGLVAHSAVALILMHFGYGVGYYVGIWDVHVRRKFRFSKQSEVSTGTSHDSPPAVR